MNYKISKAIDNFRKTLREKPTPINGYHLSTWDNFEKEILAIIEESRIARDAGRWRELERNQSFRVDRYYQGRWQKPETFQDVIEAVDQSITIRILRDQL